MPKVSIVRILVDGALLASVGIPLIVFEKTVTPYQRGFYCDDESIRYPYKKDTISSTEAFIGFAAISTFVIVLFEVMRLGVESRPHSGFNQFPAYTIGRFTLHRLIVRLYIFIGFLAFGGLLNQFLTSIGKYSIGRLRPHFIDICKPEWKGLDQNCSREAHVYVTDYTCTGVDTEHIHKAHLSFPSGHSSFSFYCAIFLCLYLQARVFWKLFTIIGLPLVQFIIVCLATYVSLSRISDYKHHWSDVFSGTVLGISVAVVTGIFVANLFNRRELPSDNENEPNESAIGFGKAGSDNQDDVALAPTATPELVGNV